MYSEADLADFTEEFRRHLRRAAQALRGEDRASRSTQLNIAFSYWLADQPRR